MELNERKTEVQCLQAEVWVLRVQTTGFVQNMAIRHLIHPHRSHPIKLWCLSVYNYGYIYVLEGKANKPLYQKKIAHCTNNISAGEKGPHMIEVVTPPDVQPGGV